MKYKIDFCEYKDLFYRSTIFLNTMVSKSLSKQNVVSYQKKFNE